MGFIKFWRHSAVWNKTDYRYYIYPEMVGDIALKEPTQISWEFLVSMLLSQKLIYRVGLRVGMRPCGTRAIIFFTLRVCVG